MHILSYYRLLLCNIEVMHKAWLRAITSFFLVIYRVLSWYEWLRAGAMCGNLTRDAVLAFTSQICVLVQQTDDGVYYSTKISPVVLVKLAWRVFQKWHLYTLLPLKMADFYCACVVPRLMHNLYTNSAMTSLDYSNIAIIRDVNTACSKTWPAFITSSWKLQHDVVKLQYDVVKITIRRQEITIRHRENYNFFYFKWNHIKQSKGHRLTLS